LHISLLHAISDSTAKAPVVKSYLRVLGEGVALEVDVLSVVLLLPLVVTAG